MSDRGSSRAPAFARDSGTVGYDKLACHQFRALAQTETLRAGGGVALTAGATWHLPVSRKNRSLPWPLNLYF